MAIERKSILNRTVLFAILNFSLILIPAVCAGQQVSRWEVLGGYSFMRMDSPSLGFSDYSYVNGFIVGGAWNINRTWSITANLTGHYGDQLKLYNYMAGPQYSWRKEKSRFIFYGLFGKAENTVDITTPTRTSFKSVGRAFAGGAGYELDLTPRFTYRVVQADYLNTKTFGSTQNDVRVSTGIVIHFGQIGKHRKR
jgi:hypothetical protein